MRNPTGMRRPRRERQTALQVWGSYLLSLFGWAVAVVLIALVCIVICASITWYDTFLYRLLNWVEQNLFFVGAAVVLVGWLVISYFFIARPVENLALLLEGAEKLAHPGEEPIHLPEGMEQAEDQLNLVREQALRNARAARDAEQRKNDLVVYLAHDLKTPLTSVIGYLTLLRDEPQLSPQLRARYTGVALEEAERLEDLVNEFFDITRFSLTHLELECRTVDLKRILEQMCSEFAPVLQQKDMSCALALADDLTAICDADKMARVFDNLLNNALHYGYPGTAIQVEGRRQGQTIVLTFQNAGRTIPPEKLSRMFEQFFRLDTSRSTGTGNAGLGLAIAKEIVEAHGGTITARSAEEQIIFTVTLPAARNS